METWGNPLFKAKVYWLQKRPVNPFYGSICEGSPIGAAGKHWNNDEDRSRIRIGNGPENITRVR